MAELKKCPFCGGEVKISTEQVDAVTEVYNFVCSSCDSYTYFDYCDREESIEAWNNRVTEADIRAMAIEEFASELKYQWLETSDLNNSKDFFEYVEKIAEQLKEQ